MTKTLRALGATLAASAALASGTAAASVITSVTVLEGDVDVASEGLVVGADVRGTYSDTSTGVITLDTEQTEFGFALDESLGLSLGEVGVVVSNTGIFECPDVACEEADARPVAEALLGQGFDLPAGANDPQFDFDGTELFLGGPISLLLNGTVSTTGLGVGTPSNPGVLVDLGGFIVFELTQGDAVGTVRVEFGQDMTASPVPLPGAAALFAVPAFGAALARRRRKAQA